MSPVLEMEKPRLVLADGAQLDVKSSVAVSGSTAAGSVDVAYFVMQEPTPLEGEDYPALVKVWDNDVDAIYDTV